MWYKIVPFDTGVSSDYTPFGYSVGSVRAEEGLGFGLQRPRLWVEQLP